MASSVAPRRLLSSGLLSRSVFPVRPAASSRLFSTNAARDYGDEEDDRSAFDVDRHSAGSPFILRYLSPSFGDAFDPLSLRGVSPFLNPRVDFPAAASGIRRPCDAKETEEGLQLRWDLPGLGREDVKVHVEQNTLVIKGEAQKDSDDDEVKFSTRIDLPERLYKTSGIKAEMKNGVLKVLVPKVKDEERRDVFHVNVD